MTGINNLSVSLPFPSAVIAPCEPQSDINNMDRALMTAAITSGEQWLKLPDWLWDMSDIDIRSNKAGQMVAYSCSVLDICTDFNVIQNK